MRAWVFLLATLLGGACPAAAGDLAALDRTIRKEPTYRHQPKYCLLVFGPEAKTRAWLVQDGDVLYVDRNCNGDLTEPDERIQSKDGGGFEAVSIRDGALTHTLSYVQRMQATAALVGNDEEWQRVSRASPEHWVWWVSVDAERAATPDQKDPLPKRIKYIINGDGLGMLVFADRPRQAPIIHLNGPWTLGLQDRKQVFTAGHPSNLQIGVGTQGVGPGTFAFVLYPDLIPNTAYPVAEVAFPSALSRRSAPTGKFTLTGRC
jgi:hypothetical protein